MGDQIVFIIEEELVHCQYSTLILSNETIKGNLEYELNFKGKILDGIKYNVNKDVICYITKIIEDGNSEIKVFLPNVTLSSSEMLHIKLFYDVEGVLIKENDYNLFNHFFTSSVGSTEIIVKIPKPKWDFYELSMLEISPNPNMFYDEDVYLVYVWNKPATEFLESKQYYINLRYNKEIKSVYFYSLLVSLAGAIIISIVSNRIWVILNSPKIDIITIMNDPKIQTVGNYRRAFYHLRAINKGDTPAYDCKIILEFQNMDKNTMFNLDGKWDRSPEPLIPITNIDLKNNISNVTSYKWSSLIALSEKISIYKERDEDFCILLKYEGEENTYGFGSWSYINGYETGFKVDGWKIDKGKYILKILIHGGNVKYNKKFIIENLGDDFNSLQIQKYSENK